MSTYCFNLRLSAIAFVLAVAAPASAQFEEKTCISFNIFSQRLIHKASLSLGFKEVVEHGLEAQFISGLQSKQWDLIGLELASVFHKIQNKAEILDLFKQQHAGGAKFIVSYAHLDEWPELQEFMGLESAVDLASASSVDAVGMGNPLFSSGFHNPVGLWSDHGDVLTPSPGFWTVGEFKNGPAIGSAAVVMDPDRTRLCCGNNFDEYAGTPSSQVTRFVQVMLLCEDDVDLDGLVGVSDFLELQNSILSPNGLGNRNYDQWLDFFDFLHFFNNFDPNCTP